MHFASNTTLTPLGARFLSVSRAKLEALDMPIGTREPENALRRGVLVREAVRSAWATVETYGSSELTNWHSANALGLDTVAEEDEDESPDYGVAAEERWLEDVLADVEQTEEPHWVEATVGTPAYEDDEYDYAGVESYTFPSNGNGTCVSVVSVADMDEDVEYADTWQELEGISEPLQVLHYMPSPPPVVCHDYTDEEEPLPELSPSSSSSSNSPLLEPATPPTPPPQQLALPQTEYIDCEDAEVAAVDAQVVYEDDEHTVDAFVDACDDCEDYTPAVRKAFYIKSSAGRSDVSLGLFLDCNDCADGDCDLDYIAAPPPLEACDDDDDDECECRTPPVLACDYSSKELAEVSTCDDKDGWEADERDEVFGGHWARGLRVHIRD